jgi:hypothetical protein
MNERLTALFREALFLVGDTDLSMDDVKIMRAFIAQGFEYFDYENKHRTSKKDDYDWMLTKANKYGVNA